MKGWKLKEETNERLPPSDVWSQFYDEPYQSDPITGGNVQAVPNNNECFIFNCYFFDIATSSAISFTNDNNKFLTAYCLFVNCHSETDGGAIYFKCDSSIAQYRSASYRTTAKNGTGQHSCVILQRNTNNINYLFENSFCDCGDAGYRNMNYFIFGVTAIKSVNSGMVIMNPTGDCNVTLSSFCNSTANVSVLDFTRNWNPIPRKIFRFEWCNVLKNEHTERTFVTFYAGAIVDINRCAFLKNAGPGFEFCSIYIGRFTIKNSYCDKLYNICRTVTTYNVKDIYKTIKLSHYATYVIEAQFDNTIEESEVFETEELHHGNSNHFLVYLCMMYQ